MKYGWKQILNRMVTLYKKYSAYQDIPISNIDNEYMDNLVKELKDLKYSENYKKLRGLIQVEITKIACGMKTKQDKDNAIWFLSFLYWFKLGEKYLINAKDFAFIVGDKTKNIYKYVLPIRERQCEKCGVDMYFRTRREKEQYIYYEYSTLCPDCMKEKYENNEVKKVPYKVYLKTEHWKQTREAAIERAGGRCAVCGNKTMLNVHHRNYYSLGEEENDDLVVLCKKCHEKIHKN